MSRKLELLFPTICLDQDAEPQHISKKFAAILSKHIAFGIGSPTSGISLYGLL